VKRTMKTERLLIKRGERAAIAIRRRNPPLCDGKNTGGYTDLVLVGPCSISVVISKTKARTLLKKVSSVPEVT